MSNGEALEIVKMALIVAGMNDQKRLVQAIAALEALVASGDAKEV